LRGDACSLRAGTPERLVGGCRRLGSVSELHGLATADSDRSVDPASDVTLRRWLSKRVSPPTRPLAAALLPNRDRCLLRATTITYSLTKCAEPTFTHLRSNRMSGH
jgi:hypothetical protein